MARKARRTLVFLFLALILSSYNRALTASDIIYIYDELGRLVAAVDTTGDTAVYNYDAVGNLLSISRYSSSQASIIRFTPGSGPVSASVTIYGTGFSATPSQNSVTFNGVAATVTSATATQIVTSVPSGATTGSISVTSPAGSATSSTAFTVSGSGGAPSITGFTPAVGTPGTAVTISGSNFETIPSNNTTKFNIYPSAVSSATSTSIAATVPTTTSGHISVTTPTGSATSSADFFVPPAPYTAADVLLTGRIAYNEMKTVTISTGNKIALYLFDGVAGTRMCLNVGNLAISHSQVTVYNPDGTVLHTGSFYSWQGGAFYEPKVLPITGTYTIMAASLDNSTGSLIVTPYNPSPDTTGTITIAGSPVTVTLTPGQNHTLTFNGTSNQKISMATTNSTIGTCDLAVLKPDGTSIGGIGPPMSFMDGTTLPVTGQYTITVNPRGAYSGNITITLYNAPDVTGTITPGGSSVTATTTSPGQNALYTFSGTAGQMISLNSTGKTFFECGVLIKKPDGTNLYNQYMSSSTTSAFMDSTSLPTTGTYTVMVDPSSQSTGSITLALYDTTNDFTGSLTIGGASLAVNISAPGQNATLTFSATAGQRIGVTITGVTVASSTITIKNPNGSTLFASSVFSGGLFETNPTPATGTYTIFVNPSGNSTGNMTLALTDISDVTGTITAGGSAVTVTTTTPGQNARLTFSGTANQRISLNITNVTVTTSDVYIYKPDGTVLGSLAGVWDKLTTAGGFIDTKTLPVTGTYTIFINPYNSYTGSMTLALYDVTDITGTITPGGGPVALTITTPGQNATLTFSGTASQQVTLRVTSNTVGDVTVTILKPNGTTLVWGVSSASSFNLSTQTLPTTGTYTVVIDPSGARTGSLNVNLTNP